MGRVVDRLSYKEMAQARLAARLRQLIVLVLTIIAGFLLAVSVNAQSAKDSRYKSTYKTMVSNGAGKCRMQNPERTHKPKNKGRIDDNRKPNASAEGAVIKKSVNSRNNGLSEADKNAILQARIALTSLIDLDIIHEMVSNHLKSDSLNESIELAPLYFKKSNGHLTAEDVNPLLIAVEFGLQGKIIAIGNPDSDTELSSGNLLEVKLLMESLGVPADRILITQNTSTLAATDGSTIEFKAF
jgi:hypothetical protein